MICEPTLPKLVICDMDGLLLDTESLSRASFAACCAEHAREMDEELLDELTGRSGAAHRQILARAMGGAAGAFDLRWKEMYHALIDEKLEPKAYAHAVLARLHQAQLPICVATSSQTDKAEALLRRAGLAGFFDLIIGGDQVAHAKPAPDIYLLVMQKMGVMPTETIILEDSNHGVRAGLASGGGVIHVPDRQKPDPAFVQQPRYQHTTNLKTALDMIMPSSEIIAQNEDPKLNPEMET